MNTITELSNWLASFFCLLVALRLITYRRGQRRHYYLIAIASWLLINIHLGAALWLLLKGPNNCWLALLNLICLIGFSQKLFKAKGDLARLLITHPRT